MNLLAEVPLAIWLGVGAVIYFVVMELLVGPPPEPPPSAPPRPWRPS